MDHTVKRPDLPHLATLHSLSKRTDSKIGLSPMLVRLPMPIEDGNEDMVEWRVLQVGLLALARWIT